jgi:uncharacterized protein YjbI with pentapeptide repeats
MMKFLSAMLILALLPLNLFAEQTQQKVSPDGAYIGAESDGTPCILKLSQHFDSSSSELILDTAIFVGGANYQMSLTVTNIEKVDFVKLLSFDSKNKVYHDGKSVEELPPSGTNLKNVVGTLYLNDGQPNELHITSQGSSFSTLTKQKHTCVFN